MCKISFSGSTPGKLADELNEYEKMEQGIINKGS